MRFLVFVGLSLLRRNRLRAGDLDTQTENDLRILGFFEEELNKIFSCYIRLSCPRTRNRQVMAECQEIRDWPLYHQVMKMAGIKQYPYNSYGPTTPSPTTTTSLPPVEPTIIQVLDNGLSADDAENEIDDTRSSAATPWRNRNGRNRIG
ncbi:hypothetical protein Fcan01_11989 [Folsomia candida]|uniref:Uncharacterized protein n=1 Tax=Folsomia candida TaxID=158441 RepID=A0A226E760_FOLCA|nr:hypothetical protein Fcan01_11989 [Folsomia candida]